MDELRTRANAYGKQRRTRSGMIGAALVVLAVGVGALFVANLDGGGATSRVIATGRIPGGSFRHPGAPADWPHEATVPRLVAAKGAPFTVAPAPSPVDSF